MVINSRARASNIRLNGTHFVCSVDKVESGEQSYGCATRNVSVVYLFNSTERRSADISHDDQAVNISCLANTSQPCHYRWRVTSTSTKNPIEILGQTIDLGLIKQDFQDMRCLAECRIRNMLCTVEPLLVESNRIEPGSWKHMEFPLHPTLLVNSIVLMSIATVILFIWKSKRFSNFVIKLRHSFGVKRNLVGSPEELQPLHYMRLLNGDVIRDQVQMLMEYLQPEEFIGRLASNGILSVVEKKMLLREQRNIEKFVKIVSSIVNTKTKSNSLLAMVIECEPNFHYVSSKVADFIEQNMLKLIECVDVDNGLADYLFSREVLTSEQYEKLSNKTRWDSYQEQNRELLSNMLPQALESKQAYKMFLAALVETDQRHVFNFINNSLDDVQVTEDDDCRILTQVEMGSIDKNQFRLINLIDPSPTFLDSLLSKGCITQRHRDRIDAQQTTSDKNKELLTIIRRMSIKTFKEVLEYFRSTNQFDVYDMLKWKYIIGEIRLSNWNEGTNMKSCIAVAWLANRICVIRQESNIVLVFHDSESPDSSIIEHITVENIKHPQDMVASPLSQSIFISDSGTRCIWMIQISSGRMRQFNFTGLLHTLSINSSDELVACLFVEVIFCLNLYRSSDMQSIKSIPLTTEIHHLNHAVQLWNGNFIISYLKRDLPDSYLIGELSSDGMNIIRSFDLTSFESEPSYECKLQYLSMDEDRYIFIADYENNRVVQLNPSLHDFRIFLNNDQHRIEFPRRICYVREKQQLIVYQGRLRELTQNVLVFNLTFKTPHTSH